jgi:hypothetical protein
MRIAVIVFLITSPCMIRKEKGNSEESSRMVRRKLVMARSRVGEDLTLLSSASDVVLRDIVLPSVLREM